jgi:hypothetical protein
LDLEGKLNVFEATAVFQMLNLAQATGKLLLDAGFNSARVFFEQGNIIFAEMSNKPMKLGQYLVREGLIDEKELQKALQKQPENVRLGSVLVSEGIIEESALRNAVEEQIKEVIYEAVRWNRGIFSFINGQKPKAQDIFIDIPIDHLMLEGLKRMDESGDKAE